MPTAQMTPFKLYRSFFKGKKKHSLPKEDAKSPAHIVYSGLQKTLRALADSLDGVPAPGLQGAIKAILYIMDNIDRANQNLDDFKQLQAHLASCQSIFATYKAESLPAAVKEAMMTLTDHIRLVSISLNQIVDRCRLRRIWASGEDAQMFITQLRSINNALSRFQVAMSTFIAVKTSESLAINRQLLIDKLTNVEGAHYNARERRHVNSCLENTRVNVIRRITDWMYDPNSPSLFWLHGLAGTGKSTVAQSIAELCAKEELLAGHFFFSRDKQMRFTADGLFTTIAQQLCGFELRLIPHLANAVMKDPTLLGARNRYMFPRLVVQPLLQLKSEVPALLFPMVVVIDALDECQNLKDAAEILLLLMNSDLCHQPRPVLKILITSRPEPHIRKAFDDVDPIISASRHVEYDIGSDDARSDIEIYLKKGFQDIRADRPEYFKSRRMAWPEPFALKKILDKSAGLFIYASTILKFVGDQRQHPIKQLKLVLDTKSDQLGVHSELDALYRQIIIQDPCLDRVHAVVGTVTLVFEPLSARQLEILLGLDEGDAYTTLQWLQSVLLIPTDDGQPIRLFHPSFHDFLTTKERSQELHLDPCVQHGRLTLACMRIIRVGCPKWYLQGADITQKDLLVYTCRFWPYHLSKSDPSDPHILQSLIEFLHSYIRVWFDAFIQLELLKGLLGSLSEIFRSTLPDLNPELCTFLCHEIDRLGTLISTKYMHLRYVVPLAIAEGLHERAIGHFPGDRPLHFRCHYGRVQRRVYQQHASRPDLNSAIETQESVIRALPKDHDDRAVYLTEMAVCYRIRYRLTKKAQDIQESVSLLQEALSLVSDQDTNKSVCCNSYAFTLLARFQVTRDVDDLHKAVGNFQQALNLPSPSPSVTASYLNNLGSTLSIRLAQLGKDDDATEAIRVLSLAAKHPSASPSVSFKAALGLARCQRLLRRGSSLTAYLTALSMTHRVSWSALPDDEARKLIKEAIACGQEASAVAFTEGDMGTAVDCFNQACITFWIDGLSICGPFFPLTPEQFQAQVLAVTLESEGSQEPMCTLAVDRSESSPPTDIAALIQNYDRLLKPHHVAAPLETRFEDLIDSRSTLAQLKGRIILLCSERSQCFAIILQPNLSQKVLPVHLRAKYDQLNALAQKTKDLWNSTWTPHGLDGRQILQELWDSIAQPIVAALKLESANHLSRTWWCAAGSFMDLPIHAATNYNRQPPEYLTDYMISSYTPSLTFYISRAERANEMQEMQRSGLLCLPPTSDPAWERGADQDIPIIRKIIPEGQMSIIPDRTTLDQVLSRIRECLGIHVASQSEQRNENPADCRFSLPSGVHLEIGQLLTTELTTPKFAYLSTYPATNAWAKGPPTCRLAYDLFAVGFTSVVATQSPLPSSDAASMASHFYAELLKAGGLDFSCAANALHLAMIKLRGDSDSVPKSAWVRVIHVGI